MKALLEPWHIVVLALAGMVNREQQEIIEYLKAENGVLEEQLRRRGGRTLDPAFGFPQWQAMKNPDLFRIEYDGQEFGWNRDVSWTVATAPVAGRLATEVPKP